MGEAGVEGRTVDGEVPFSHHVDPVSFCGRDAVDVDFLEAVGVLHDHHVWGRVETGLDDTAAGLLDDALAEGYETVTFPPAALDLPEGVAPL